MTDDTPPTPTSAAEPLVSDDQIINSVYQLTYRVVDAIALQEMRAMMYKLRDKYEARIAELQGQLDAARAGSYVPVEDGEYKYPNWDGKYTVVMSIKSGSSEHGQWQRWQDIEQWIEGHDNVDELALPDGYAVCKLQPASAGSEGTVQDGTS